MKKVLHDHLMLTMKMVLFSWFLYVFDRCSKYTTLQTSPDFRYSPYPDGRKQFDPLMVRHSNGKILIYHLNSGQLIHYSNGDLNSGRFFLLFRCRSKRVQILGIFKFNFFTSWWMSIESLPERLRSLFGDVHFLARYPCPGAQHLEQNSRARTTRFQDRHTPATKSGLSWLTVLNLAREHSSLDLELLCCMLL